MLVIPAIDIKDGRCVRLRQGQLNRETVFSEIPEEIAVKWVELGAERLHLIDLNGAVEGRPVNKKTVKRIIDSIPVSVEVGGGIRDEATIEAYIEMGAQYVILGTTAYKDPDFVEQMCKMFPGKIIVGIDAKNDRVAVEGWSEYADSTAVYAAKRFEGIGVCALIYTDIQRDGMCTGPNLEATRTVARAVSIPIIASGGISSIGDVERLLPLSKDGVIGMITGRALYDGSLDLQEAIRMAR